VMAAKESGLRIEMGRKKGRVSPDSFRRKREYLVEKRESEVYVIKKERFTQNDVEGNRYLRPEKGEGVLLGRKSLDS